MMPLTTPVPYSFRWVHVTSGAGGYRVQEGVGTDYEVSHPWNHPLRRAAVDRAHVTFNSAHDDLFLRMTGNEVVDYMTNVIAPAIVKTVK